MFNKTQKSPDIPNIDDERGDGLTQNIAYRPRDNLLRTSVKLH